MKNTSLISTALSLFIMFCLAAVASADRDRITVRTPDGQTQQFIGSIIEETYEHIKMEVEGQEREIPIVRDGEQFVVDVRRQYPPVFTRANMARDEREFETAFERYRESAESGEVSEHRWLAAYLRYNAADAAYLRAEYGSWEEDEKARWFTEAAERFEKLLEEDPKHRLAPNSELGLARSLTKAGELVRARETFDSIEASDYPYWIRDEADVWRVMLLISEGDYDAAIEKAQELRESLMENNPELAYRAKLFEGLALTEKGQAERAEAVFQQVGLQSPDNEMQAVAWNERGLSLYGRGELREALLSFLRVAIMHPDIRNEAQRALYYASLASEGYYGEDDRAQELVDKLRTRFPDSYWAQRVEE